MTLNTGSALDLYARGFLLATPEYDPPSGWLRRDVGGGHILSHDPRVSVSMAVSGRSSVWLIGRAVDVRSPTTPESDVVGALARDLEIDRGRYLRSAGFMAGRHVLIDVGPQGHHVIQDAAGARSVVYHESIPIIGSHVNLVGDLVDAPVAYWAGESLGRLQHVYPPGDATARDGVRALTPNTQLDLRSMSLARFYPDSHLPTLQVDEVAEILIGVVPAVLQRWHNDEELYVSLTAGLDSRLTLAFLREIRDSVTFFTYHSVTSGVESHHEDVRFAGELTTALNLRHVAFEVPTWYRGSEEFSTIGDKNHPYRAANGLIESMRMVLPADALHIKSQHYEIGIGRTDARLGWGRGALTPETMELLSTRRNAASSPRAVAEYAAWADRVGLDSVGWIRDYDLFYWEHRMGTWGAGQMTETDVVLDSVPAINARVLYEAMLGVSLKSRREGKVARLVIERQWPELLKFPINGVRWA